MEENKEVLTNPDSFHAKLQELAVKSEPIKEVTNNLRVENDEVEENAPVSDGESEVEDELEHEDGGSEEESPANPEEEAYKDRKFIPKSRFNQEIEKRKVLEEKWMAEREEKIRLEERLNAFSRMQEVQAHNYQAPEPVYDLDTIDALDSETHQVYSREIKQLKEQLQRSTQQSKQIQYANLVTNQEAAFVKDNPDYMKAATYLRDVELNGAKEVYGDDTAAHQLVLQKYQQLMTKALESGKSVPETIYKLAKTYGYKPEGKGGDKTGSNLKAINANMKKSASIGSLGNSVGLSGGIKNIDAARKDPTNPKSPFDPEKFKQLLQKVS